MAELKLPVPFPSVPFLVSILHLPGSLSLQDAGADGDWMLSQMRRTLSARARPLSQSHPTCKGGFVSLPFDASKTQMPVSLPRV